jgi:hypothetical protein
VAMNGEGKVGETERNTTTSSACNTKQTQYEHHEADKRRKVIQP